MKTLTFLMIPAMALSLMPQSALAWNAYHLYNKDGRDIWAIECADGTLHSYAGSSSGLGTVGPALCEDHGGIANPGGDPQPVPATVHEVDSSLGDPKPEPTTPNSRLQTFENWHFTP
ncbi:hypothetical protein [Picosynechococcus sp. PCC 7117]|uniref:hypothetical protein n=1 Tax=Picosynechococcus sp. PCC 7117 TaxID=195498 RepID=UPI0008109D8C|nr:hypothetical protein [Picosynechococcus sp. PCC 7117]ANV87342.1 hypothetical protein AWQ22_07645 [Picosynechococcus sp. PCC 7117]